MELLFGVGEHQALKHTGEVEDCSLGRIDAICFAPVRYNKHDETDRIKSRLAYKSHSL